MMVRGPSPPSRRWPATSSDKARAAATVRDTRGLQLLVVAFLGVLALYMLHSLREYVGGRHVFRMGIARLVGVDSSLNDPNSFGGSIVYALPFALYLWEIWRTLWL